MKHFILVLGVLLFCFNSVQTAYAGSLNDNEIIVLEEAKKAYEYNGILYQVDPIYIQMLTDYLSRDDIDITAEDSALVLKTAYDSIEIGVLEGYLIPVEEQVIQEENDTVEKSINTFAGTVELYAEVRDNYSSSEIKEIMDGIRYNEEAMNSNDVKYSEDIKDSEDNTDSDEVIDIEDKDISYMNHNEGMDQTVEVILEGLKEQSHINSSIINSSIDGYQQSYEDNELGNIDFNFNQTIIILTGLGILMVIGMIATIRQKFFAQQDE